MTRADLPAGIKVTYRQQYRHCGKPNCASCGSGGQGHGPYWYAFWSEGGRMRSRYVGKQLPAGALIDAVTKTAERPDIPNPEEAPDTSEASPSASIHQSVKPHLAVSHSRPAGAVRSDPPTQKTQASAERDLSPVIRHPDVLRVCTLGGFQVWRGTTAIPADSWNRRKVAALFKCLLGAPAHRLHREQIGELLWPDVDPVESAHSLRTTIHLLRQILDDPPDRKQGRLQGHRDRQVPGLDRSPARSYLRSEGEWLVLVPALEGEPPPDWLDAIAFAQAATAALASRDSALCRTTLALYRGAYLPEEVYADWAVTRREALHAQYIALLLHLADLGGVDGDLAEVERCLRRVLVNDPCHEVAAQRLMGLLLVDGRRAEALQVYQALATSLRAELAVSPAAETKALRARLLAQETAPRAVDHAPHDPAEVHPPTNLPAPLTSFVGREREQTALRRMISSDTNRLITLTGAGGCGKTRLALQVAADLLPHYVDGVWLVELAAQTDATLVDHKVAGTLGLREEPDRSIRDLLIDFLAPRQLLLILDNCEHLIGACADLVATLLSVCSRLHILATSREALGIAGEIGWRVPSLSLATGPQMPPLTEVARCDAVRLFMERARRSRPDFALTPATAPAIMQICRQLDGIPLALELAAARLALLSVDQLAARLTDRFRLLTSGSRTALPRHQTLRATLDWSYALLDMPERVLLQRLAVFSGGWTLEAVETICSGGEIEGAEILDLLFRLVAKSLVMAEEQQGEARCWLLETVRQYAHERLDEAGESAPVRDRHLAWYLSLVEQADRELVGPEQAAWLARLEQDHDNLRAALAWSGQHIIQKGSEGRTLPPLWLVTDHARQSEAVVPSSSQETERAHAGLALAGLLWRFWHMHGHLREGRTWIEETLAHAPDAPAAVRARALNGAGTLSCEQGDYAHARALYEESLDLRRELGDILGVASVLSNLGVVAQEQGDVIRAATLYEESATLRRQMGDRWGLAAALNGLGNLARRRGDFPQAAELYEQALAIRRELGDKRGVAAILNNLGNVYLSRGNPAQAEELLSESLRHYRDLGDKTGIALALTNLGNVFLEQRDSMRALAMFGESLILSREVGDKHGVALCLEKIATLAAAQPDMVDVLPMPQRTHRRAACEQAVRLLAAAAALRDSIGAPLPAVDQERQEQLMTSLRSTLGDATFVTMWTAGQTLAMEDAITLATDIVSIAGMKSESLSTSPSVGITMASA